MEANGTPQNLPAESANPYVHCASHSMEGQEAGWFFSQPSGRRHRGTYRRSMVTKEEEEKIDFES
jgi:hypothetical protein